mgnify:CR=1 FL=1
MVAVVAEALVVFEAVVVAVVVVADVTRLEMIAVNEQNKNK